MLELKDLYNPFLIVGFFHKNGNQYLVGENQGFQVYYAKDNKTITVLELWQKMDDGRLFKVQGWYGKSIHMTFHDY